VLVGKNCLVGRSVERAVLTSRLAVVFGLGFLATRWQEGINFIYCKNVAKNWGALQLSKKLCFRRQK